MGTTETTVTTLAAAPRRKLSAELHALNERFGQDEVQVGEVLDVMGDRAYSLLLVLLALPFFTPVSLLGISTVVGAVIAYLGLRLALGLSPRLPQTLRRRRLPPRFFGALLRGAERVIRLLERCTRKRLPVFVSGQWMRRGIGLAVLGAALLLMLPLPIPFSNFLPAVAIIALAVGRLEEDGAAVCAGFVALAVSALFFAALALFGVEIFDFVRDWFASVPSAATGTITPP